MPNRLKVSGQGWINAVCTAFIAEGIGEVSGQTGSRIRWRLGVSTTTTSGPNGTLGTALPAEIAEESNGNPYWGHALDTVVAITLSDGHQIAQGCPPGW